MNRLVSSLTSIKALLPHPRQANEEETHIELVIAPTLSHIFLHDTFESNSATPKEFPITVNRRPESFALGAHWDVVFWVFYLPLISRNTKEKYPPNFKQGPVVFPKDPRPLKVEYAKAAFESLSLYMK
jgi:hypothetical protein